MTRAKMSDVALSILRFLRDLERPSCETHSDT